MKWLDFPDNKKSVSDLRAVFGNFYSFKNKKGKIKFRRKGQKDIEASKSKGWRGVWSSSIGNLPRHRLLIVNEKLKNRKNDYRITYLGDDYRLERRPKGYRDSRRLGE